MWDFLKEVDLLELLSSVFVFGGGRHCKKRSHKRPRTQLSRKMAGNQKTRT